MGKYITWADVVDRYPSVATRGGADELTTTYINYAEREVESMLAGFYTIPFATNNATAKDCMIDVAYIRVGSLKVKEEDAFRKRLMHKIERLKNGSDKMILEDDTVVYSVGQAVYSNHTGYEHTFGHGPILDMEVDSDLMQVEEDARHP